MRWNVVILRTALATLCAVLAFSQWGRRHEQPPWQGWALSSAMASATRKHRKRSLCRLSIVLAFLFPSFARYIVATWQRLGVWIGLRFSVLLPIST
jgi:hypothetical protein